MSRYPSFLSFVLFFILVSCQKEKSFEQAKISQGSLQSSSGDCLPKSVGGTYKAGQALADSNYIEVVVDVAETGQYKIVTDTVNGYYFTASGNFSSTGPATVRLKGAGTPTVAGTDDFAVLYDSTLCSLSIPVGVGVPPSGGTSAFTLQGNGTTCVNFAPAGTYTQGTALTSTNKVTVEVNVTRVGTWTMGTTTVAGITFSGSGTFANTGVQTVTLDGVGTPTVSGPQTFNVAGGTSSCSFTITVIAGTAQPLSNEYFPLTQGSYWTYDDGTTGSDTVKITVSGTETRSGKTYQRFVGVWESGPPNDTLLYRKDAATGFYYNYFDTSGVGITGLTFSVPGLDVLFMKNTLATGNTWNSDFNATLSGFPVVVRFKFTCVNANATVTANGKTFNNVYQVQMIPQVGAAGSFQDLDTPQNFYYAKGIGQIKVSDQTGDMQVIRYWQVL